MATCNGERFLSEQLDSLASQTVTKLDLWISDDGSKDRTKVILEEAARNWKKGKVRISEGPKQGFVENFRSLMIDPSIDADFYAFSDQDDIWDEDKLAVATEWLSAQPDTIPALYCSRTRTVSENGVTIGYSPLFKKVPSFRNAIVQSIAGANTMVMNRAARDVIARASQNSTFVSHDWWCYLIVSGVGGRVFYSPEAKIGYRQHQNNLVGENRSLKAKYNRLKRLIGGGFQGWNRLNLENLEKCKHLLSEDAYSTLAMVRNCQGTCVHHRLLSLLRSGVYRQTGIDQAALIFACAIRGL
ncbi:glycosyltransferase [Microbulbifer hydrolyticus]|nr:glycosyltransferase [Microbulbifer hydrolyticus]